MTKFMSAIVIASLIFTSCSKDESLDEVTTLSSGSEQLLKTYTLSKDANGNYSIDYEVSDYTAVDAVKNAETSANEFYLSTGNIATETKSKENLIFEDDYLEVGFYGDSSVRGLVIEDDASADESTYLESYSIQDLGDDTYQVDFTVQDGIAVSFNYNEEEDIYEIHLTSGASATKDFSKTFVVNGGLTKIDFVNYIGAAKSAKASSTIRRPRVIPLG